MLFGVVSGEGIVKGARTLIRLASARTLGDHALEIGHLLGDRIRDAPAIGETLLEGCRLLRAVLSWLVAHLPSRTSITPCASLPWCRDVQSDIRYIIIEVIRF